MRTTCPYCGVGCGVTVETVDANTYQIKGDTQHPANQGRLCSKGTALADTLNSDGRLLFPDVNGKRVGWDFAIDHIASELNRTIAQHGRDSVAFYVSGQILTEDYYVVNKLTKGWLGTGNIDTNSRLCMASSVVGHKRAFGTDTVPGNYNDLEEADLIVLVGSNLAWCHPVLYQRILAARERRPEMYLVVIDPRRTVTAEAADLHLPIQPDSDSALFNGLLSYLYEHGGFDPTYLESHVNGVDDALQAASVWTIEEVAGTTGVDIPLIEAFYAKFTATAKALTVYSQGVNQSVRGTDKVNAIINCHLATGRIGKPGAGPFSVTGQPNAMGGREVGGLATMLACHMELTNPQHRNTVQRFWQSPRIADSPGLCAVDMFKAVADGKLKAIWIIGTNPVDSLPDANAVRSALQACPLVIVSDVVDQTDSLDCANIKLPALAWGEKEGTVTNSERCISRQRRIKPPVGEARADWWAVSSVACKMGYSAAFDYSGPAEIFREYAALSGCDNYVDNGHGGHGLRDFDISACTTLSDSAYEELEPFYWPWRTGRIPTRPMRFFADGGFFTTDRRARMLPIDAALPARFYASEHNRFILNTGRNRDQWHTMTRTGYSVRLSRHLAEPYVAIHPADAHRHNIKDADLVRIRSNKSQVLLRALLTDRQQVGHLFVPIHWSEQFAANARVDSLVSARVDPFSNQPAFKNQQVVITRYAAASYAYGIMREKPAFREWPDIEYWAIAPVEGGWQFEAASPLTSKECMKLLIKLTSSAQRKTSPKKVELLTREDDQVALASAAVFKGLELQSLLFAAGEPVQVSRSWAQQQLDAKFSDRAKRWQLLAGRAIVSQADKGAIVCSCHTVGVSEIERAVNVSGCKDVTSVGKVLQAGTNCGSCRSEIQVIINRLEKAPSAYEALSAVS